MSNYYIQIPKDEYGNTGFPMVVIQGNLVECEGIADEMKMVETETRAEISKGLSNLFGVNDE